jgi:hypothetical protein
MTTAIKAACTPSPTLPHVKEWGRGFLFPPPLFDTGEDKGEGACIPLFGTEEDALGEAAAEPS